MTEHGSQSIDPEVLFKFRTPLVYQVLYAVTVFGLAIWMVRVVLDLFAQNAFPTMQSWLAFYLSAAALGIVLYLPLHEALHYAGFRIAGVRAAAVGVRAYGKLWNPGVTGLDPIRAKDLVTAALLPQALSLLLVVLAFSLQDGISPWWTLLLLSAAIGNVAGARHDIKTASFAHSLPPDKLLSFSHSHRIIWQLRLP
jgi:hypothetical protein